ncbi:YceI family protein [Roseomonas alkaliterrae]|jgi:polyisoprenoid-binding protein YceI|uniref:Polyisoprenoid-binding protein YceI n=1 Tax=Neoroseomonas alkaliterrae TaxID=1452450 RepID=A0A840Y2W2_9PROT|nr:YceI family protein [Neoroseomonas alkaliterrae]MBB5688214.1 polyisoprenoid-binding protein YceI [Neoroseomonas alkaliterrae]MBR0678250.1 YceI family protein [Neoroseomonas alkaliterrae]
MRMGATSRRGLLAGLGALAGAPARPAAARSRYVFDARAGQLEFTARHLGVLTSTGRFEDFEAELLIDPERPLTSQVAVTVRTAAVALAYPGAVDLLRSPAFFDVERFPEARFSGRATGEGRLERFALAGELTIRGITRPHRMEARLVERRQDPALGREVAAFSAGGTLRRSEFGMTAEQAAISDEIRLTVRVRILV